MRHADRISTQKIQVSSERQTIDGRISLDGETVEETIGWWVYRARDEFETPDGIVGCGLRGFQFQGDDLVEFVRRSIYGLLDAGAKPFAGQIGGAAFYPTDRWGTSRQEIADALIAEWKKKGGGYLEFWSYPFTFVEDYYPDGWPEPER